VRSQPDVLVIGGGAVGLFCAYHLRRAGAGVAVVERGVVGGPQSCSSGNTGFVGTQSAPLAEPGVLAQGLRWLSSPKRPFSVRARPDPELLRWLWHFRHACTEDAVKAGAALLEDMKRRSLEILRQVCATGGLASTLLARGIVVAYRTPAAFERASRSLPAAVARGVRLRALDPAALRALEPEVAWDVCGAVHDEDGACLRTPDFVVELARLLEEMGVEIQAENQVLGFGAVGGRVVEVRTPRGDFRPQETVIAAGAWSAQWARRLSVRLELQPARGYSVTVRTPRGAPRLPVLLSEGKVAVLPLGDRLRFGGTLELAGLDRAISERRVEGIRRTVQDYLPELERTEALEVWCGLRPCTPDGLPLIGRAAPYRNLSVACGHGHVGMGLAPVTGRLIAQVLTGEPPDMDMTPFRVGRYGR
jgi:D-amino-acid dehydrogenase